MEKLEAEMLCVSVGVEMKEKDEGGKQNMKKYIHPISSTILYFFIHHLQISELPSSLVEAFLSKVLDVLSLAVFPVCFHLWPTASWTLFAETITPDRI